MKSPLFSRLALIVALLLPVSAHADDWDSFITAAASDHGEFGQRAAQFLADHRPQRDDSLLQAFLLENLRSALTARDEFPWGRACDDEMFFNDVLPYASLDETREPWRSDFYLRCRRIVDGAASAADAAQRLNRDLFDEIGVHYNTGRSKPNQSPAESIAQGRATCSGLSIILVNACRSVGIPARIAGVANWADKRGNHTWVEIWDDGWHFTGADEYTERGLNHAWFERDAASAAPGSEEHAVWATSWKHTDRHFPLVWDRADRSVPAVDVTARYQSTSRADANQPAVFLRVWNTRGGDRITANAEALDVNGAVTASVTTRAGKADLNDMPQLPLHSTRPSLVRVTHDGTIRLASIPPAGQAPGTVDLFFDELGLSRESAEALLLKAWTARSAQFADAAQAELDAEALTIGEHTLRFKTREFGEAPQGERSLWISLHGGGGTTPAVNDQQWNNQARLYQPEEGIYIAPRAPTDSWNMWHQSHIDPLFDRLITCFVVSHGVDPDRVYLLGYSAGGDGVYQLAPRMADRFAAAAMMAGHPNEARPLGLRNLPFALLMGGQDAAYQRNEVARRWGSELAALRDADPNGYPHRVIMYEGLGHWMDGKDAEILPWLAAQVRNPWPSKVVWHQDDVTHGRFYWLAVDHPQPGTTIKAAVSEQLIELTTDDLTSLTLRLRDELIDLDRPIKVTANDVEVFHGFVMRSPAAIEQSLDERMDHSTAATALLKLDWNAP